MNATHITTGVTAATMTGLAVDVPVSGWSWREFLAAILSAVVAAGLNYGLGKLTPNKQ